jgi:hypothetical protein
VTPTDSTPFGIVVERRETDHPWQDYEWQVTAVIPGATALDEWKELDRDGGKIRYYAGTLDLELFKRETEGYRVNLSQSPPSIYVVMRPDEEEEDHEYEPFLLTACAFEAQDYLDTGEELVEAVPMPPETAHWIEAFINEHHVEIPFKKRKRKSYDPRKQSAPGGGDPNYGKDGS